MPSLMPVLFPLASPSSMKFRILSSPSSSEVSDVLTSHSLPCFVCRDQSDLVALSSLGHFLKGSSATLGMVKVRDSCEKIQQYGKRVDDDGTPGLDQDLCLERIRDAVSHVKDDYADVEKALRKYYSQFD